MMRVMFFMSTAIRRATCTIVEPEPIINTRASLTKGSLGDAFALGDEQCMTFGNRRFGS